MFFYFSYWKLESHPNFNVLAKTTEDIDLSFDDRNGPFNYLAASLFGRNSSNYSTLKHLTVFDGNIFNYHFKFLFVTISTYL